VAAVTTARMISNAVALLVPGRQEPCNFRRRLGIWFVKPMVVSRNRIGL
jgi:hypothetical protein